MRRTSPRSWRGIGLLALALAAGACSRGDEIRASGTIEMDEVDVSSLSGGRVLRLTVNEGDSVHVGDTLAVLDRGELVADLEAQAARRAERGAWRLRAEPPAPASRRMTARPSMGLS